VTSKFAKNRLRLILIKLGVVLEVDETFTTIWLSRSSEVMVKVRRWPQSPFGTIFDVLFYAAVMLTFLPTGDIMIILSWHDKWIAACFLCIMSMLLFAAYWIMTKSCFRCRLTLPGAVVEDGRESASYDCNTGLTTIVMRCLI